MSNLCEFLWAIILGVVFYLFVVLFLLLAPAQGDPFPAPFNTVEEANAHANACLVTDWQIRHFEWNPCAARVSLKNYGLYLFGHTDRPVMYLLYSDSLGSNNKWATLEIATYVWEQCRAQLVVDHANVNACNEYYKGVSNQLNETHNSAIIYYVASRTWLATLQKWSQYYNPNDVNGQ